VIGISQTGSDLVPCNRHHLDLAVRVKEGIRDAGGIPMEFPVHPVFENCRRPTAALDRNLSYLGSRGDALRLPDRRRRADHGCDKTTPAAIMAASTVDIPAIVLSGGPMLDGYFEGELVGSGMAIWKSRRRLAAGQIDEEQFFDTALASAPSAGHCNTMGTASTMNAVAEVLGLSLPGCAAIPAPYRERGQMSYDTGKRIVEMAYEDLRPSKILTREAFLNAIVAITAIGGSTNAQPHIMAMARHAGVELERSDWEQGYDVPLLVNMQPAGKVPRRALPPRRRRARRAERAPGGRQDRRRGDDRHGPDAGRERRGPGEQGQGDDSRARRADCRSGPVSRCSPGTSSTSPSSR
jgi:dihydroxy-acid dehydratase